MKPGGKYPLADKVLGGILEQRLREGRERGVSHEELARELHADDIAVSSETVRQWCHTLGIEETIRTERAS